MRACGVMLQPLNSTCFSLFTDTTGTLLYRLQAPRRVRAGLVVSSLGAAHSGEYGDEQG